MKATGIVRRIDDLGRVVIPKEIRRTMRIREGDPLEIYTDHEGEVIFKKYSPIGELTAFAVQYAESLYKTCGVSVAVADRDCITACAGMPKKDYLEKRISPEIQSTIENRTLYVCRDGTRKLGITSDSACTHYASCVMPILTEGDLAGCVIIARAFDGEGSSLDPDTEAMLAQTAAVFLGKQLES